MASLKFQKSALAISFSTALLSMFVATPAQSANDAGELLLQGSITFTTCVLSLGDPQSTGAGKKTMNFGSFTVASTSGIGLGGNIGAAQTAVLRVQNGDGTQCTAGAGNSLWDVGININATNYETVSGVTVLKSTAVSGTAATGVGVKLLTAVGTSVTVGTTAVDFTQGNATYGTLLSSNGASAPAVAFTDGIAVTAQMVKANGAVGAGSFSHSIPLNVWYQ